MLRSRSLSRLLTLIALVFLPVLAHAQDKGSISGRVTDKRTGHAIPFANVAVVGAQRGALTSSEGDYVVTGVPVGTWEVKVQYLGYRAESRPGVMVTAGKAVAVNFQLQDIVVSEVKTVEVTAERRLVEVKQGTTIRSVGASEIRNLPVQTIGEVLQQQAGINTENDQIHVRGGRADETIFVVNGVANRDLVTGQSTAGQLNARSVAEVNVATGAYDVRYGNALSGVVEIKLKEGGDRLAGGLTLTSGTYGGRAFQGVVGGPDPVLGPLFKAIGLKGTVASILDVSGNTYETRFLADPSGNWASGIFSGGSRERPRLRSSYEDSFFGSKFTYGDFFSPAADNRWSARFGVTWKPGNRDRVSMNFSKRIGIDQGFSRTFINATGDQQDPAYPWIWDHRINRAQTIFEDNAQSSIEWRRSLSTSGYTSFQLSRYFFAQREDVGGQMWPEFMQPDDRSAFPDTTDARRDDFFIDSGDDDTWQDRRTLTYAFEWGLTQRIKRHEIEVGFEHQLQSVQYLTIQDPWIFDRDGLGRAHDLWQVHPWVGNFYMRDRLEYEGFTANIGVRGDYWFLGREAEVALADTANPNITSDTRNAFYGNTHDFFGRRFKFNLSPRVIVAHPISENSSFFFNYGQFTQNPSYRYVYSKLTSISSESFPLLGNPNINPQVSVNYEVGAKHQFLPRAAVNVSFFVKDVYDYPTATRFEVTEGTTGNPVPIFVYLNGHFARSKGFEIEFEKRRSSHWAGKLTYTFQQTKGKSSDANEQKVVQAEGGDASETRLSETFVNWNRPHKLSASFDLRYDDEAPGVMQWFKHSGFNLFAQGLSGRPYTPADLRGDASGSPNSKNALFQITTDVRVNRYVRIGGRRLDLSLAGTNVFGNQLIYRVDPQTGRGRVFGDGSYDPENPFLDVNDYVRVSQLGDPSNYGPGAQWRLSLDYDF